MDFRPVFFSIGVMLSVLGAGMLVPMIADLRVDNPDWKGFFLGAVMTGFFGGSLILSNLQDNFQLSLRQTFILASSMWLLAAGFGALPLTFSSLDLSFTDAFFESMSGITTTGATILTDIANAPPGVLIWRAILQWLGGVGVVLMALSILPRLKVGGMQIFRAERSDHEKSAPRTAKLLKSLIFLYVFLTALCAGLFMKFGLPPFHALTHAMTTLSTGGFSSFDYTFTKLNNPAVEITAALFMLLGALPFVLYLRFFATRGASLFRDSQVLTFLGVVFAASAVLTLLLTFKYNKSFILSWHEAFFTVSSMITGTGFAIEDYNLWGGLGISILFFLMMMGGCAGSTTCGIKVFRFQVLYEIAKSQILHLIHPSGVFLPRYNKKTIQDDTIISVMSFFFLFATFFALGSILLSFLGLDLMTALSGAASALANVGPGMGDVIGPLGTYEPLPDSAKWALSILMLLGRMEFFTALVLLYPYFWRE